MKHHIGRTCGVLLLALVLLQAPYIALPGSVRAAAPPVTTLTITGPAYGGSPVSPVSPVYVNSLTNFTLTSVDANGSAVSDIWYRWNDYDYTEYTGPFTAVVEIHSPGAPVLPIDLEGDCTLYYNATDSQGNSEPPKSMEVFVDDYPPVTELHFNGAHAGDQEIYVNASTTLTITASDSGSGLSDILYRMDEGQWKSFSGPIGIPTGGAHTLGYRGVDNLGNREDEHVRTLSLDDTAPTVSIILGQPAYGDMWVTSSANITIAASDSGSGILGMWYRVDENPWTLYSGPFHLDSEGRHTVSAYALDLIGNPSETIEKVVSADNTPPVVSVPEAAGGTLNLKAGRTFTFNASDAGTGASMVFYSTDGGLTWSQYREPIRADRNMILMYYAEDALGNAGQEMKLTVTVSGSGGMMPYAGIALAALGGILAAYYLKFRGGALSGEADRAGKKPSGKRGATGPTSRGGKGGGRKRRRN